MEYEDYYFIYGEPGKTPEDKEDFLKDDFLFKEIEKADAKQVIAIYSLIRKYEGNCEFKDETIFPLQKKKKILNLMLGKMNNFKGINSWMMSMLINDTLTYCPRFFESNKNLLLSKKYIPFYIMHNIEFINLLFKKSNRKKNQFMNDFVENIIEHNMLKCPSAEQLKSLNFFLDYLEKEDVNIFKQIKKRFPFDYKKKFPNILNIIREVAFIEEPNPSLFKEELNKLIIRSFGWLKSNKENVKTIMINFPDTNIMNFNNVLLDFLIDNEYDSAIEIHKKMHNYNLDGEKNNSCLKLIADVEKRLILKKGKNSNIMDKQEKVENKQKKRI